MAIRILLSKAVGKQKTKTDGSNSIVNVVGKRKMKMESIFRWHGQTKNETGSSNSIFLFCKKTVGTKVHAFFFPWTSSYCWCLCSCCTEEEKKSFKTPFGRPYRNCVFQAVHFLEHVNSVVFLSQPIKYFPSFWPVSKTPHIKGTYF